MTAASQNKETVKKRYWEVDLARGVAVVMMIIFHTLYDLDFLGIAEINVHTGFWRLFAYATASSFVFLVGLSLSISSARAQKKLTGFSFYLKYLKRGIGSSHWACSLPLLPGWFWVMAIFFLAYCT